MVTQLASMTFDEFFEIFRPIKNTIRGDAPEEGYLFEAPEEMSFVARENEKNPNKVWTLLDDGGLTIVEGFHTINAVGYFITEEEYDSNVEYCIFYEEDMFSNLDTLV